MGIQLKNVSYSYKGKLQAVKAVDGVSYGFGPGKSGINADLPQL